MQPTKTVQENNVYLVVVFITVSRGLLFELELKVGMHD